MVLESLVFEVDHEQFVQRALNTFGGKIVAQHRAQEARDRLLCWIRSLQDFLGPVDRWCLVAEALTNVRYRASEPHRTWAGHLLDGELTEMLHRLHLAGYAREFPSPDPLTWKRWPRHKVPKTLPSLRRQQILNEIGAV